MTQGSTAKLRSPGMRKRLAMTREDALALLDTFRLHCEEPPAPDPALVARRFVRIVCPDRLAYERGADRAGRGR